MNGADVLSQIVASKRREIVETRARAAAEDWKSRLALLPAPPDFAAAIAHPRRIAVIAEVKKASPSAGVIRQDFDPVAIAQSYDRNGADCISVLTDRAFFQGDIEHLRAVATAVRRPMLRKDFVLDMVQIWEARLAGASAVLLIAECLAAAELAEFVDAIDRLRMTALVELHDAENLPAVLASGAKVIGINNRDLRTFHTDVGKTLALLPEIPRGKVVVSESGLRDIADVKRLHDAGVSAILVGESFMRATDPGAQLAEWRAELDDRH